MKIHRGLLAVCDPATGEGTMAVSCEVLDDGQIVAITAIDPVEPGELTDALDESARVAKAGFSLFVDGSGLALPTLDPDTMLEYVVYFKKNLQQLGLRIAVLPPPGMANDGFLRMMQMLADERREVALFETRDEALAWLVEEPDRRGELERQLDRLMTELNTAIGVGGHERADVLSHEIEALRGEIARLSADH